MHVSGSSSEPQSQPRRAFSTIKTHSHAGTDPVIKHTSALTLFHISRDLAHLAHSVLSVPSIWASFFSLADKHHPVLCIPVLHRHGSPQLRADSLHTLPQQQCGEPSDSTDQGIRKCLSSRALMNDLRTGKCKNTHLTEPLTYLGAGEGSGLFPTPLAIDSSFCFYFLKLFKAWS